MGSPQPSLQENRLRHDQTAAQREEEPEKQPRPRDWLCKQQSATSLAGLVHIMAIRSSLVRRYVVQHASYTKPRGNLALHAAQIERLGKESGSDVHRAGAYHFPWVQQEQKMKRNERRERKRKRKSNRWPPWLFPECPLQYLCRPDGALGSIPLFILLHTIRLSPHRPIPICKISGYKIKPRKGNRSRKLYRKLMAQKQQVPTAQRPLRDCTP